MNERICFYMPPFPSVKSYFDMVDITCEFGLKYLELLNFFEFEKPDKQFAYSLKEYADKKGVGFSCFSVYINLVGDDSNQRIADLKGYAQIAKILGCPYLHHTIANDFSNPDNVLPFKDKFFEKGVQAVREIYDYCENLGIKSVYEEQGYLFNGTDGFKRFLEAVQRDVGVVADFANIYQSGEKPEDFIAFIADRAVHAHIKDITLQENRGEVGLKTLDGQYMHEAPIGDGIVGIKRCVELLKAAGYNGFYSIEYGALDNDPKLMTAAINYINSLI